MYCLAAGTKPELAYNERLLISHTAYIEIILYLDFIQEYFSIILLNLSMHLNYLLIEKGVTSGRKGNAPTFTTWGLPRRKVHR